MKLAFGVTFVLIVILGIISLFHTLGHMLDSIQTISI